MPDFFFSPQDVTRAGLSRPVSDITFPQCSDRPVMLLAERGGIRNLGLDSESIRSPRRTRRARCATSCIRTASGARSAATTSAPTTGFAEGAPYMFANCAGGVTFGYGYTPSWTIDQQQPDQFVWMTGDALCSPNRHVPGAHAGAHGAGGGRPLGGPRHPGPEGEHASPSWRRPRPMRS